MNSMRNVFNSSTVSTINTNIFTSNYSKLINNISQNRKKNSNNKYIKKNHKKGNSISMKFEKEEEKSLSMHKYLKNFNDSKYMYKSESKIKKAFSKIINYKSNENCPLSCQHKSTSKVRKSLHNKMKTSKKHQKENKMKKSNSALNLKVISK